VTGTKDKLQVAAARGHRGQHCLHRARDTPCCFPKYFCRQCCSNNMTVPVTEQERDATLLLGTTSSIRLQAQLPVPESAASCVKPPKSETPRGKAFVPAPALSAAPMMLTPNQTFVCADMRAAHQDTASVCLDSFVGWKIDICGPRHRRERPAAPEPPAPTSPGCHKATTRVQPGLRPSGHRPLPSALIPCQQPTE